MDEFMEELLNNPGQGAITSRDGVGVIQQGIHIAGEVRRTSVSVLRDAQRRLDNEVGCYVMIWLRSIDYAPVKMWSKRRMPTKDDPVMQLVVVLEPVEGDGLNWRSGVPRDDGVYWCRYKVKEDTDWVMGVIDIWDGYASIPGIDDGETVAGFCAGMHEVEWAGPIEPPKEGK